jgi:hypothetical protein
MATAEPEPTTTTSPRSATGVETGGRLNHPTVLPFTGLDLPRGAAVDSAGKVCLADFANDNVNDRVLKLPVH